MPYTLNGFGTRYYGKREQAEDGSYVTTLWITALYVPLLPLRSYRVKPVGQGTNWGIHRSQNYQVLRVPMCWEQVWHVYMIAAPILVIIAGFAWSEVKKDRARDALHDQIKVAGTEINAAQQEAERLESGCLELLKNSKSAAGKDAESRRKDLHDRCAPIVPAVDTYVSKVGAMQDLIGKQLSESAISDTERSYLNTYQSVWRIRRHQAGETRQIALCLADVSHECYAAVSPLFTAMNDEDKQACTLLASVKQKCE